MPQARGPLDAFKDLAAIAREHMTDEELNLARLRTDTLLYGFCVIDGATGQRIDPVSVRPADY